MTRGSLSPEGELAEVCAQAVTVTAVDIHVDPLNLDRIFVIHSEEREPITFRIRALEMPTYLQKLAEAVTRSMN